MHNPRLTFFACNGLRVHFSAIVRWSDTSTTATFIPLRQYSKASVPVFPGRAQTALRDACICQAYHKLGQGTGCIGDSSSCDHWILAILASRTDAATHSSQNIHNQGQRQQLVLLPLYIMQLPARKTARNIGQQKIVNRGEYKSSFISALLCPQPPTWPSSYNPK